MRRLIHSLGSRRATGYLFITYGVFVLFLLIWGARIPASVVRSISTLAPFWLVYVVAFVHLVACLVVSWPLVRQRVSLAPPEKNGAIPLAAAAPDQIREQARTAGLRWRWLEPNRVGVASRWRWSSYGTVLFHAALLLLPLAFAVSRLTHFEAEAWIVEGHPVTGTRAEYTRVEPADSFERRAPRIRFDVEGIDASFWEQRLFFTDLRALVRMHDGDEDYGAWMTLTEPLRFGAARVSLRGFNYTPALELTDARGKVVYAGDLSLRLFPPGAEDHFTAPELPHRFWVRLYPDSSGLRFKPATLGPALVQPLLHLAVTRGKRLVAHGWLRPGEALGFDGYQIRFPAIRRGGDIAVLVDWGYPLAWIAFVLALVGAMARIVFASTRVWIFWDEQGAARAIVRQDPFAPDRAATLLGRLGAGAVGQREDEDA